MSIIGITGGIGSGKSYVCKLLEKQGIKVYDCDSAAKRLMAQDVELQQKLSVIVGDNIYYDGKLQKSVLAQFLLQSDENKLAVDDIVHPAVARDFLASGYSWLESAILFDSGFNYRLPFDYFVAVTAPVELRISRIMHRDSISREQAMAWIDRQMPQDEVSQLCNFVINNDGHKDLNSQINQLIIQIKNI
ncbi:MAG: dephospho-CoA kinase [Prevotella sp.]|nr:dephospho-CoA kinase [Prevotella sp.]MDD3386858.1 dephospho-CoA kinase [Prevotella sp.]MDD4533434.1 dephospho-CoA kinase [Prevotella sp.]